MYMHAFLISRATGEYTHYLFSEDDYLPLIPHFDAALVRMHRATFSAAQQRGCPAGVLQGRPVEPSSPYLLHLESSHLMSTAALDAVLAALLRLDAPRLGGAGAAMVQLAERAYGRVSTYFGRVQLGFGLLLREAGV